MAENWKTVTAADVEVGQRVRANGIELTVSRIETSFLGREGMRAFIEDTPQRWFKRPMQDTAEVEVTAG